MADTRLAETRGTLRWGSWRLDPSNYTLIHDLGYDVDLEEMRCSAEILDWIFQVRDKTWATPDVVSDLLSALRDILHPQANYCSFGGDKRSNPRRLIDTFLKPPEPT